MNAGPIIVFLVLVLISVAIGAISQVLKNAQVPAPPPPPRPRGGNGAGPRAGGGEIDRFLEEIDKLRRKKAAEAGDPEPPPVARPVAERPRKPKRAEPVAPKPDPVPTAEPVRRRRVQFDPVPDAPRAEAPPPLADIPVVTAAAPEPPLPPIPTISRAAPTEFAKSLAALLASKQGLPLAVVLTEVLGPPKSQRRPG